MNTKKIKARLNSSAIGKSQEEPWNYLVTSQLQEQWELLSQGSKMKSNRADTNILLCLPLYEHKQLSVMTACTHTTLKAVMKRVRRLLGIYMGQWSSTDLVMCRALGSVPTTITHLHRHGISRTPPPQICHSGTVLTLGRMWKTILFWWQECTISLILI